MTLNAADLGRRLLWERRRYAGSIGSLELTPKCTNLPGSPWEMSEISIDDGLYGGHQDVSSLSTDYRRCVFY